MYQVTVSVENEKYCGVFEFGDLYDAAQKVEANIWGVNATKVEAGIKRSFNDDEVAFFWCTDERGSYCKIDRV
jgi:hypothetical protein